MYIWKMTSLWLLKPGKVTAVQSNMCIHNNCIHNHTVSSLICTSELFQKLKLYEPLWHIKEVWKYMYMTCAIKLTNCLSTSVLSFTTQYIWCLRIIAGIFPSNLLNGTTDFRNNMAAFVSLGSSKSAWWTTWRIKGETNYNWTAARGHIIYSK